MPIQVHNLIVHRVDKERHGDPNLIPRDDVLQIDDRAIEFVESLHEHYVRDAKKSYGKFDVGGPANSFENRLRDHLEHDVEFVAFSHLAMEKFMDTIHGVQMATGGYIVFAHYTLDDPYLTCLMLKNTASFAFTEDMNLRITDRLDMEHLRHGSSIYLNKWATGEDAHLSFISAQDEASEYFQQWIGCTTSTGNREANQNLRVAVHDYIMALAIEEDEKIRRKETLFDFAQTCKRNNEPLRLDQVAQFMNPDDPGDFVSFASAPEYAVDAEIAPNPRVLKPMVFITHKGPGYQLEIKEELIISRVFEWREEERKLVFHDVPEALAEKLREIGT